GRRILEWAGVTRSSITVDDARVHRSCVHRAGAHPEAPILEALLRAHAAARARARLRRPRHTLTWARSTAEQDRRKKSRGDAAVGRQLPMHLRMLSDGVHLAKRPVSARR